MKNDFLKAIFIIWGVILFLELLWFSSFTNRSHSKTEAIFATTVIAVTSVFGSVGIYLFKREE
ncbi:hypothetical protein ACFPYN_18425 [Paenisporosarcina macmurdoensis]|uniref:DUF3923 family protein n=1 Tax=Paenisporosarcina macmurdoensis TaxID=212659 RepID=A0ABW1LBP9_9BACL